MRLLQMLVVSALLAACANPLNEHTARRYYAAGEQATRAGNLPLARENYRRALINAQIGHLGPEAEADAAGKLARIQGNLCEHDEAEKTFLYALEAQEKAYGKDSPRTLGPRLELAQLAFDIGRFEKATGYFEKAFAVGGSVLESRMALGYADLLEDYATALSNSGRSADAETARARAHSLKQRGGSQGGVKSRTDYVPYPKTCK